MVLPPSNGYEKPDDQRVRRNEPRIRPSEITADGVLRGPELPECPDKEGWCPRTLEWYDTWRRSPNAQLFAETDWESLLECCIIHNRIWNPNRTAGRTGGRVGDVNLTSLMGELRRRVGVWGATHYDRVQLKLSITTPQTEAEASKSIEKDAEKAVNYAEELAKAAAKLREQKE